MGRKANIFTKSVFITMICLGCVIPGLKAETAKQEAVPIKEKLADNPANVTAPPKIDVMSSALCKKCVCDKNVKQLDCTNKGLNSSEIFSDDEWKILQNGDLVFETIKLEHNNLTKIPVFRTYGVKNLYLAFNQIDTIPVAAFQNLSEITKLDLSHNSLTSKALVPDVFKGMYSASDYLPLKNLRELDLGYNKMHNLHADLFEHLPNLQTLTLGGNIFHVIATNTETAISGLLNLKTLDMSYMEISKLPDNFLHGLRDLETLILSGNLFKTIPNGLELAVNLKELVLDENPINDIAGENIFPPMLNLEYLSISYMQDITQFGAGAFSNLTNLKVLIASNNAHLSYFDEKAFQQKTSNSEFYMYPPLEKLYLHNNNLTRLEHDMLERWDKILIIDLRYNPWTCDCDSRWLILTLMMQVNGSTPQLTTGVTCFEPVGLRDTPLLLLNTQQNKLVCHSTNHVGTFLVGSLVGILLCIPIVLGSIALWRRGCFGFNRSNSGATRGLYNRADFNDDLHI